MAVLRLAYEFCLKFHKAMLCYDTEQNEISTMICLLAFRFLQTHLWNES